MKYVIYAFRCLGCGWRAPGYEARIPEGQDPAKCGPVECGRCRSIRFLPELVEKKERVA